MIYGIGTDIVKISRLEELRKKYGDKFLTKILSEEEIEVLPNERAEEFIAGRFAVKEALVKALDDRGINFSDVTILNKESGKPYILNPEIFRDWIGKDNFKIEISISHEREFAVGFVVIEM